MNLSGPLQDEIFSELYLYYKAYYKDRLGLPDWESRCQARLHEEETERIHLERMVRRIGSLRGKKLLNVGCGTGGFNVVARQEGAETFGVDSSERAIAISRKKARLHGMDPAKFQVGLAEGLPFGNEQFDRVYCLSVIEHVNSVEQALKEMLRVLKPGGLIYLVAPNANNFYEGHYKIFWFPRFPRGFARLYLRLRGRPTGFLSTLNEITPSQLISYLRKEPVTLRRFEAEHSPEMGLKRRIWVGILEAIGIRSIEWAIHKC